MSDEPDPSPDAADLALPSLNVPRGSLTEKILSRHQKAAVRRIHMEPSASPASELLKAHGVLTLAESGVISEAALRLLLDAGGSLREGIDQDVVSRSAGALRIAAALRREAIASLIDHRDQAEREDRAAMTSARSAVQLSPIEMRMAAREARHLVEAAKATEPPEYERVPDGK